MNRYDWTGPGEPFTYTTSSDAAERRVEFKGIISGDWECFCWAVDRETFVRFRGEEPDERDRDRFHAHLFRLYPDDVFAKIVTDNRLAPINRKRVRFSVSATEEKSE